MEDVVVSKELKLPWLCLAPEEITDVNPAITKKGTVSKTRSLLMYNEEARLVELPYEELKRLLINDDNTKNLGFY